VHTCESVWSPLPFVVAANEYLSPSGSVTVPWRRVYYLWTPWTLVRLPYAHDISSPSASGQVNRVLMRCPECETPVFLKDASGFEYNYDRCPSCDCEIDLEADES
jgi:hypothetical protein